MNRKTTLNKVAYRPNMVDYQGANIGQFTIPEYNGVYTDQMNRFAKNPNRWAAVMGEPPQADQANTFTRQALNSAYNRNKNIYGAHQVNTNMPVGFQYTTDNNTPKWLKRSLPIVSQIGGTQYSGGLNRFGVPQQIVWKRSMSNPQFLAHQVGHAARGKQKIYKTKILPLGKAIISHAVGPAAFYGIRRMMDPSASTDPDAVDIAATMGLSGLGQYYKHKYRRGILNEQLRASAFANRFLKGQYNGGKPYMTPQGLKFARHNLRQALKTYKAHFPRMYGWKGALIMPALSLLGAWSANKLMQGNN